MRKTFADGALQLTLEDDVASLTLDRPDKRNAINKAMWRALPEAIDLAETDPGIKVLVLSGAGGHFAAGADIGEFEAVYATRETAAAYSRDIAAGVDALAKLCKPTIARIQGACVGGGMALALACDLRMAASDSKLGITPGKLGLMYSLADTKRLVDAVGGAAAKDLLFSGRIVSAGDALAMRLVGSLHAADQLDVAVLEKAKAIAAASQWSARKTKAVVALILSGIADDTDATRDWFLDATEGADFIEGRDAFLAKRTPVFPFR